MIHESPLVGEPSAAAQTASAGVSFSISSVFSSRREFRGGEGGVLGRSSLPSSSPTSSVFSSCGEFWGEGGEVLDRSILPSSARASLMESSEFEDLVLSPGWGTW